MDAVDAAAPALRIGSRAQVMHGTARQTAGGLRKDDLVRNKRGRIVSRKRQTHGLRLLATTSAKTRRVL
jgi:hypothetical protein